MNKIIIVTIFVSIVAHSLVAMKTDEDRGNQFIEKCAHIVFTEPKYKVLKSLNTIYVEMHQNPSGQLVVESVQEQAKKIIASIHYTRSVTPRMHALLSEYGLDPHDAIPGCTLTHFTLAIQLCAIASIAGDGCFMNTKSLLQVMAEAGADKNHITVRRMMADIKQRNASMASKVQGILYAVFGTR